MLCCVSGAGSGLPPLDFRTSIAFRALGKERVSPGLLFKQSEHGDSPGGTHINLAVDDGGSDEFVSWPEMIPGSGLIAVIELLGDIGGVVSVQNCSRAILHRPQDGVGAAVRRDTGGDAGIPKAIHSVVGGS